MSEHPPPLPAAETALPPPPSLTTPPQIVPESNPSLSVLLSFPVLLRHETSVVAPNPHSVSAWRSYVGAADDVLSGLDEAVTSVRSAHCRRAASADPAAPMPRRDRRAVRDALERSHGGDGGGHGVRFGSYPELVRGREALRRARSDICERALAVLPGSYVLWRMHLSFRCRMVGWDDVRGVPTGDRLDGDDVDGDGADGDGADGAEEADGADGGVEDGDALASVPPYRLRSVRRERRRLRALMSAYARSLVRMNKYPRIWISYARAHAALLPERISASRRIYDGALAALPATQHHLVWPDYLAWAERVGTAAGCPETALRVGRRYCTFDPGHREALSNFCAGAGRYAEAAELLAKILDDDLTGGGEGGFVSPLGSTRHQVWERLCDLAAGHPSECRRVVPFEAMVRAAIGGGAADADGKSEGKKKEKAKFGEVAGTLWCKLAAFHVRAGEFEAARSVYEEALEGADTVRDFSLVYDGYTKFEEGVVASLVENMGDDYNNEDMENDGANPAVSARPDVAELLGTEAAPSSADRADAATPRGAVELAMARAEYLLARRPLLLSSVLLRQNPHDVGEWLRRADLFGKMEESEGGGPAGSARALAEATRAVDARKAVNGRPSSLWARLAEIYEEGGDAEGARGVFTRVCDDGEYEFRGPDDLAVVWTAWAEMELRLEDWEAALGVARRAIATPRDHEHFGQQRAGGNKFRGGKAQSSLYRSLRLWNLYLDLEESLGGIPNTKAAYTRCIELGVATPQIILNSASFLKDQKFFEESFSAYEKGLGLFPFPQPHAAPIWTAYLEAFEERYGGSKMERSRELYERCLEGCPAKNTADYYLKYARLEEKYGLAKRALAVYERAALAVPQDQKLKAYQLYVAKARLSFGLTKTRPIYEAAIAALNDADAAKMCIQFSEMEVVLGEIERARKVLEYGSQMADPRRDTAYWKHWHEFEVAQGNEESFREMLRIKRSVQASFSTVNYNAAEMSGEAKPLTDAEALAMLSEREGVSSGPAVGAAPAFVTGTKRRAEDSIEELEMRTARLRQAARGGEGEDDGEIELEDEEEGEAGGGAAPEDTVKTMSYVATKAAPAAVSGVAMKVVPAAVFGGLSAASEGDGKMSTLEKLKAAAAAASSNQ
eukprot:CAMPEP_0194288800 /NCGR_PEP_ID=MMETSP0169-20130528/37633_1 /TAXON_ID=218684 /ORGANISM="Corethron pennatum, Strain L29A3" /LENGTH=1129 /DNA_ID=CAMNT_0039035901 /DNA_START=10 /DNA_END=3399 /DNA_ORIENTATION=-